jgi:VanZ family protein
VRVTRVLFRSFWTVAAVAIAAFTLFESTRTAGDPALPDLSTAQGYLGHALLYAALAFCLQTAMLSRGRREFATTVVATAMFGVAIEAYQSTLEGREGSVLDALTNLGGAMLGAALASVLSPAWRRWLGTP